MIIFIAIKMLQERLGFLLFWPDVRAGIEVRLRRRVEKIKEFFQTFNTRTVYIILHYMLVKIRQLFSFIQQKIDKRLVHLVNLIKGKRLTEARGKASNFLHDINRFKDKFRRQW